MFDLSSVWAHYDVAWCVLISTSYHVRSRTICVTYCMSDDSCMVLIICMMVYCVYNKQTHILIMYGVINVGVEQHQWTVWCACVIV